MNRDSSNWTTTSRVCVRCGKHFEADPSNIRKGHGNYCSRPCARAPRKTPEERFWSYVEKTDSCWLWTGAKISAGYGAIRVGGRKDGKIVYAHIFSWELHNGPVPKGMEVCHNCPTLDNPACIRPDHLFIGTHKQNMADASAKGRIKMPGFKGEQHPGAKLTKIQVAQIRKRYAKGGILQRELAAEYGIEQTTISRIVRGASWN